MHREPLLKEARGGAVGGPVAKNPTRAKPGEGIGKVENAFPLKEKIVHPDRGIKFRTPGNSGDGTGRGGPEVVPGFAFGSNGGSHLNEVVGHTSFAQKFCKQIFLG
jgi:hypothetical protein